MTAPAGAEVRLYVDLVARVLVGDVIETRSGRRYLTVGVRLQARGKHRGRQHLACVVLDPEIDLRHLLAVECARRDENEDLICSAVGHSPDDVCDRYRTHGSHDPRVHRIRWYRRGPGSGGVIKR